MTTHKLPQSDELNHYSRGAAKESRESPAEIDIAFPFLTILQTTF
jgi:hypothetical protein